MVGLKAPGLSRSAVSMMILPGIKLLPLYSGRAAYCMTAPFWTILPIVASIADTLLYAGSVLALASALPRGPDRVEKT